jgi:hypothetical protein
MKLFKTLPLLLCIAFAQCSSTGNDTVGDVLSKDKIDVTFTGFFDQGNNREVQHLDAKTSVTVPHTRKQELDEKDAAEKYDLEGETKTIEDLNQYLEGLKRYTRYIFEFNFDGRDCKVYTTEGFEVTHIILVDKRDKKVHYLNESFFASGYILRVVDTQIRGKDDAFTESVNEKTTVSLFNRNKLFYRSEEKAVSGLSILKLSNKEAFHQMQDAFCFHQLCRDVALKLKEEHPDLFQ